MDQVPVRRAYKFVLRPTAKQVAALEACLEDHRQLYSAALEERRDPPPAGRRPGRDLSNGSQAASPRCRGRFL
jgi:putative transposase